MIGSANGVRIGITGLGTCVPERVLTNDDLARYVDTIGRVDRRADGDPGAADRDRGRGAVGFRASRCAGGAGGRRCHGPRYRPRDRGDGDAGHDVPDDVRDPRRSSWAPTDAGAYDLLAGLHRLHVRDRPGVRDARGRAGRARARRRRRRALEDPGLDRSLDARAVRRRCRRRRDGAASPAAGSSASSSAPTGPVASISGFRAAARGTSTSTESFVKMNGREVFKFATRVMVSSATAMLEQCGRTVDDVDVYVPHQANKRIIDHALAKLGIPEEKTVVNVDRYGNTSSGSIPLALADARADGRLQRRRAGADDGDGCRADVGLGARRMDVGSGAESDWMEGEMETDRNARLAVSPAGRKGKVAFCFPGQGSLTRGWAGRWPRRCPRPWRSTGSAREASGLDLQRLCFDAPLEELVETEVQQPALVTTSLAILAARARARHQARRRGRALGRRVRGARVGRRDGHRRGDRSRAGAWARDGRGGAPAARARWPRSSGSRTRRSRTSAGRSSGSGRRTTTARGRSSSRARTARSRSVAPRPRASAHEEPSG